MNATMKRTVWWIDGGGETCDFCLQRYAYEVERRCSRCDGPACPRCVVKIRETRQSVCVGCHERAEGS